mmetsp:Transcript_33644/g.43190  ORF Transcript_33644/g.43190 Transcript_33644/m.43190 type:complete len:230 (-) Transcript_33644:252-941(-)
MVAESTVILAPISQLGWVRASFTVALCMSSTSQSRKAPPEAVRMIRRRAPGGKPWRDWKMALCSESAGIMVDPYSSSRGRMMGPPAIRVSLLARAISLPPLMASMVGRRPAHPTIPVTTVSASSTAATAQIPSFPAMIVGISDSFMPCFDSASFRAGIESGEDTEAIFGLNCATCFENNSTLLPADRPMTSKCSGFSSQISSVWVPIEPVDPRRLIFFLKPSTPSIAFS